MIFATTLSPALPEVRWWRTQFLRLCSSMLIHHPPPFPGFCSSMLINHHPSNAFVHRCWWTTTPPMLLFIDVDEPTPLPRFDLTKYVKSLFLQERSQQQTVKTKEAGTICGVLIFVFYTSSIQRVGRQTEIRQNRWHLLPPRTISFL